jgi:hypothetical protein
MDQQKMAREILKSMLQMSFERIGTKILKKNPEFTLAEMKAEASRLTSIYLENYDPETNSFDMELIKRISGINFPGE